MTKLKVLLLSLALLGFIPQNVVRIPGPGGGAAAVTPLYARTFNGSSQYLSNTSPSGAYFSNKSGGWAVCIKMLPANLTDSNRYVWVNKSSTIQAGMLYGYAGGGIVEMYASGNTGDVRTGSQETLPDSTGWHSVCYDYDGTALYKWLDGSKTTYNAGPISVSWNALVSPALYVGQSGSSANYYHGALARFIFANSSQSDTAFTDYAGATCSTTNWTNIQGYWMSNASPETNIGGTGTDSLTVTGATQTTGPTCSSQ